ncbi:MAG: GNAT family N-acetyltransferase [Hyphomicrobiales bacterium]
MSGTHVNAVIRPAQDRDLDQVIALDERITGINKRDYIADLFERYRTRRPEQRFFYVAENAGRVIGFVVGEIRAWEFGSEPCGWVFAISVDPELREDGVGAGLLDRISESFRDAGVSRLRTMISRNNHLLMAFFRSRGMIAGPYLQLEKDLT